MIIHAAGAVRAIVAGPRWNAFTVDTIGIGATFGIVTTPWVGHLAGAILADSTKGAFLVHCAHPWIFDALSVATDFPYGAIRGFVAFRLPGHARPVHAEFVESTVIIALAAWI